MRGSNVVRGLSAATIGIIFPEMLKRTVNNYSGLRRSLDPNPEAWETRTQADSVLQILSGSAVLAHRDLRVQYSSRMPGGDRHHGLGLRFVVAVGRNVDGSYGKVDLTFVEPRHGDIAQVERAITVVLLTCSRMITCGRNCSGFLELDPLLLRTLRVRKDRYFLRKHSALNWYARTGRGQESGKLNDREEWEVRIVEPALIAANVMLEHEGMQTVPRDSLRVCTGRTASKTDSSQGSSPGLRSHCGK